MSKESDDVVRWRGSARPVCKTVRHERLELEGAAWVNAGMLVASRQPLAVARTEGSEVRPAATHEHESLISHRIQPAAIPRTQGGCRIRRVGQSRRSRGRTDGQDKHGK